jgi:hypothetical protein
MTNRILNADSLEKAIWVLVRVSLTAMAAAGLLWASGEHLYSSIAHAANSCYSSNGYTPDSEAACSVEWSKQDKEPTVSYYAPRGFPCHGAGCYSFYRYDTSLGEAVRVYKQAFRYLLTK